MTQFSPHDNVANVGRLGVLFLVVCGYVMLNVPARVMIIELLFKKNEAKQEASYSQFLIVTVVVNFACLIVGLAVSDLSVVLGISGAVATPMISFVFPALFTIFIRAKNVNEDEVVPLISIKQWDMYLVLALGVCCSVVFIYGLIVSFMG
eukprot:TRINITY_DN25565_c1_g1_i1.p1 TRINITY_DN25565_c1_g1~~TRINITY_DN25565_c1_g1_i1.p1  ORF type:complete len:150 (-),score=18.12 TRINITY_DN25565_c1_g1_i1:25-474(-)